MSSRLLAGVLIAVAVGAPRFPHAAWAEEGPVRLPMIGHRGDGTGVFPDQCAPVAEWSEEKNVVWKTPLPNLGNSSPICVGDRVFVTCEPGWKSDSPLLVCIDARHGKVLWQREIDPFDLLPDEQRVEAQAWRAEFFELWREAYRMTYDARNASSSTLDALKQRAERLGIPYRNQGKSWAFGHEAFWHGKTDPYKRLEQKYDFIMPIWHYAVAGMTHATPVSDGEYVYVHTAYKTVACYDLNGERQWMRWHRDEPYTRYVQPDKWHERDRGMHFTASFVPSPILMDDKLIVNANIRLRAYDKRTGETLWEHTLRQINYMLGPPVPLKLKSPDGGDVACVFLSSGELVRVADGRVLVDNVGNFAAAVAPIALGPDTIFGVNGMSGGHYHIQENRRFTEKGGIAIKFRLVSDDRAEAEQLWFNRHADDYEMIPVYHDGVVYMNRIPFAFDAATGERLGIADRAKAGEYRTSESLCIADGRLFTLNDVGKSAVFEANRSLQLVARNQLDETAPVTGEKQEQIIAQTGMDQPAPWYAWQFGRSSPFFSGNRIFIRSFDHLYCLGDPQQAFRAATAFTK